MRVQSSYSLKTFIGLCIAVLLFTIHGCQDGTDLISSNESFTPVSNNSLTAPILSFAVFSAGDAADNNSTIIGTNVKIYGGMAGSNRTVTLNGSYKGRCRSYE
jgi:hypothetical protein